MNVAVVGSNCESGVGLNIGIVDMSTHPANSGTTQNWSWVILKRAVTRLSFGIKAFC